MQNIVLIFFFVYMAFLKHIRRLALVEGLPCWLALGVGNLWALDIPGVHGLVPVYRMLLVHGFAWGDGKPSCCLLYGASLYVCGMVSCLCSACVMRDFGLE